MVVSKDATGQEDGPWARIREVVMRCTGKHTIGYLLLIYILTVTINVTLEASLSLLLKMVKEEDMSHY